MITIFRWIARVLGLLFNLATLLIIGLTLNPIRDYPLQELPALIALLVANAGIIMAWKWEGRGGLIACVAALVTGVALYFSALSIGESQSLALIVALVYGLPYLIVGAIFLGCNWRTGVRDAGKQPKLSVNGFLLTLCGLLLLPLMLSACGDSTSVLSEVPDNRPKLNPADYPPILFVHGHGDQASLWINTLWLFESNGYPAARLFTINLRYPTAPFDGNNPGKVYGSNDDQRSQLATKVDEILAKTGAKKLALIANSRGGLVIRNYLERGGGASKVSHIILGGTPNHGVMDLPIISSNEFNGAGDFQKDLNGRGEVVPGVDTMTIRSDRYDKYAQPRSLASPIASGYRSPELKGALNIVLDGLDHRETAYHPRAFAQMYRFITGIAPSTTEVTPEANPRIGGLITGYEEGVQTNIGVSGVKVSVFEVDSTTGQRKGAAVHVATTGTDGAWGNFVGRSDAYYEFVAQTTDLSEYHFYRTPFPRSTELATFRLQPEKVEAGKTLVVFTRPRGFISNSRDKHLLDGKPVPGVEDGVPTTSAFRVDFSGPERSVPASLNGESMTIRTINGAIVYAEFTK